MMKEQFIVYTAKNGSRYLQTKNFRLADAIAYLTGARYYKITIHDKLVLSFQYSEELMNVVNNLDSLRIK